MNKNIFSELISRKILVINLVNSLIALPFLLNYYLGAHGSPAGLGIIEVGALGIFLIGPLSFISSVIATYISKEKSFLIIIKSISLLLLLTYVFTAFLLVKGIELITTFVTIFVFMVLISTVGYILTILVCKFILKK